MLFRSVNFPDIFCIFNEVKRCIFVFCEFLEGVKFLENRNNIFEDIYLKAFLRQSFRVFDFSNLSSDSRYLESVTLKFSAHSSSMPEIHSIPLLFKGSLPSTMGISCGPRSFPVHFGDHLQSEDHLRLGIIYDTAQISCH